MNWAAVGAIGEMLGAAGVIVTLVYLAHEIRLSAGATRLSTSHSIASAARDWNRPLLEDPDLAWAFHIGTDNPMALGPKERARFIELCFSLLRMFEDAYYQYQHGALDAEVWSGYERLYIAYALAPGFQMYWKQRRDTFRPDFRAFIDSHAPAVTSTWGKLAPEEGGVRNSG